MNTSVHLITIQEIIKELEQFAPPAIQENWDNSQLLVGNAAIGCTGVLISLDITEAVIEDAIEKKCNLIVAHHPVIFKGLRKLTGNNGVERTIIAAIKANIALYAIHTNLDNRINGVSGRMGEKLGLLNCKVMQPTPGILHKLVTYVPNAHAEQVKTALFKAGAGKIGSYEECSFSMSGMGTFMPLIDARPFVGSIGKRHEEPEVKLEVQFESWREAALVSALIQHHPYESVAYEILKTENKHPEIGAGIIGSLPQPMQEQAFLQFLKQQFQLQVIRHTSLRGKPIQKVALCGGAGSFLISKALSLQADIYITGDIKYHEFFGHEEQLIIADIGHFESEQFTIDLLYDILLKKFPNFAVLKSGILTNPVQYFK